MERHPDIEIYIKQADPARIKAWLTERLGPLEQGSGGGKAPLRLTAHYQGQHIPILLVERAAGAYSSLWFQSPHTPWATDIDCAREAFQQLGVEIRCSLGSWRPEQGLDDWWHINAEGEGPIQWPE